MSAGIEKQQIQFGIILLPDHQPIRFNMAFPLPGVLSAESMWSILCRERTGFRKNADGFLYMRQIQTPLLAEF